MEFQKRMRHPALSFILFLVIFLIATTAEAPAWNEHEKAWFLSLTYPDERPGDFGVAATAEERALLERFKPRVIVSERGLFPVDFYRFYLPNTVVRDSSRGGRIVATSPSREYLKRIERDRHYYLDYTGPLTPCEGNDCQQHEATGYGRVYREIARFRTDEGIMEFPIIVLKYNFAFPFSGLPSRLGFLRESFMRLFFDPVRFHELDIHGAVQIILNESERPVVLLLSQHNHSRSYLIGRDVPWPGDGPMEVCFAERSNEPYPCPEGAKPRFHRAVANPANMAYVIDGRKRPLVSGEDKVCGLRSCGREVKYRLEFLPDRDPLYVSWIPLGERRRFYRSGPPGMNMNTWPALRKYGDIMQFWYWRDGSDEDASLMERSFKSFTDVDFEAVLLHNGKRLFRDLGLAEK